MSTNPLKVFKVCRICNKIRTFLSLKHIDLSAKFDALTFSKTNVVPNSDFIFVINTIHPDFALSVDEAIDLVEFFQDEKCTINYKDFISTLLHSDNQADSGENQFISGLEWVDPRHENILTPFEERHSSMILTKIAQLVKLREIVLEPYFEDYEAMTKNGGTITVAHFRRVLNSLGITLGIKEFRLVTKKFMKHNYTINYCGFIDAIRKVVEWMKEHGKDECCPGRVITCNFEQLPRPEFEASKQVLNAKPWQRAGACKSRFETAMLRIKKHILDNSIKTRNFFEQFDKLKRGFVTRNQFARGLDAIGVSGLHRLTIGASCIDEVMNHFMDPCDPDRVSWTCFCDEIDQVFIIKHLEKDPLRVVKCPPTDVKTLNRPGTADWEYVPRSIQQCAQQTVFKLRRIIETRGILIEPFFKIYDVCNRKHVTKLQMRRVFSSNSIVLCDKEIEALMTRYGNNFGFNYMKFLKDINETYFSESKHEKLMELLKILNKEIKAPCSDPKMTIIEVLAKIKGQIVRRRIHMDQFMRNGENLDMLNENDFRRNFSAAGIILEECELDILVDSFKIPSCPGNVDHMEFLKLMRDVFYQTHLESEPCKRPHQHLPTPDGSINFLNFDERLTVSCALQKLARFPDEVSNLTMFFRDYYGLSGDVDRVNFDRALLNSGLSELLTTSEIDVVFKCFTIERGKQKRFNYRNFSAVLSEIYKM